MAGEIIRPKDLTPRPAPVASELMVVDNSVNVGAATIKAIVEAGRPAASQAEAQAGTDAAKAMTPLTTKQSIAAEVGVSVASKAQGDLAATAVQPGDLSTVAATGAYADLSGKPTLGSAAATDASAYATAAQGGKADTALQSVVPGANVFIDSTDPRNPVISSTGGVADGDKGDINVSGAGTVWTVKDKVGFDDLPSRVKKQTNLFPHGSFVRGGNGWSFSANTSENIMIALDPTSDSIISRYFGRSKAQLDSTAAARNLYVGPSNMFSVDRTKAHKIGFWGAGYGAVDPRPMHIRVYCFDEGANMLAELQANVNMALAADPTSSQYIATINPTGGAAPAFPAGTVSALATFGFGSTAAGQGVHFHAGWMIPADEYPAPLSATIVNNGGGTHEGVRDASHLYVVNHGMNYISKFDANMKKVADLACGDYPHDITLLGGNLWVVNQDAANLQRIPVSTFTVGNTYAVPGGRSALGVCTDGVSRLWVGAGISAQTPTIYEVNTSTGAMTALSTDINGGSANIPLEFLGGSLWSVVQVNSEVKRINPAGGATIATINCGINGIYGLGVGGGFVWANGRTGVAKIDPATNTVVARYAYRDLASGQSNIYVDDSRVYACASQGVMIIDIATGLSEELVLDGGGCKWVHALPGATGDVVIGAYGAPWLHRVGR